LPFEGLEKLVAAIKEDISNTERLGDSNHPKVTKEKEWIASDVDPNSNVENSCTK